MCVCVTINGNRIGGCHDSNHIGNWISVIRVECSSAAALDELRQAHRTIIQFITLKQVNKLHDALGAPTYGCTTYAFQDVSHQCEWFDLLFPCALLRICVSLSAYFFPSQLAIAHRVTGSGSRGSWNVARFPVARPHFRSSIFHFLCIGAHAGDGIVICWMLASTIRTGPTEAYALLTRLPLLGT